MLRISLCQKVFRKHLEANIWPRHKVPQVFLPNFHKICATGITLLYPCIFLNLYYEKKITNKKDFPSTGNCEEGPFVYQLDTDGYPTEELVIDSCSGQQ